MEDLERQEEASKSPLFTTTDRKVIIAIFAIVIGIAVWLFFILRESSRFITCQDNVREIGSAIKLYMADNGERLPPAFTSNDSGGVALDNAGRPRTWLTHVYPFVEKRNKDVFTCPSADPDEFTHISNPDPGARGVIDLTYGMFTLVGTASITDLQNPESTALLAETSPGGHQRSVDPIPLANGNDGFLIGFDDSNTSRSKNSRHVTRLAIRQENPRNPTAETCVARHANRGVVVLYAGLNVGVLDAERMFLVVPDKKKQKGEIELKADPLWLGPEK